TPRECGCCPPVFLHIQAVSGNRRHRLPPAVAVRPGSAGKAAAPVRSPSRTPARPRRRSRRPPAVLPTRAGSTRRPALSLLRSLCSGVGLFDFRFSIFDFRLYRLPPPLFLLLFLAFWFSAPGSGPSLRSPRLLGWFLLFRLSPSPFSLFFPFWFPGFLD